MNRDKLEKAVEKILSIESIYSDIQTGMEDKKSLFPKSLFKFRSLTRNSINNIEENTLWFDNPLNMNDPYDCRFMWDNFLDRYFISAEEFKAIYENAPEQLDEELYKDILNHDISYRELLSRIKIDGKFVRGLISEFSKLHEKMVRDFLEKFNDVHFCSLAEKFDSILMWTHYSDNHTGFCLEYDLRENISILNSTFPVFYKSKLFNISKIVYDNRDKLLSGGWNKLYPINPLIYKAQEWEYEQEWRVIIPFGKLSKPQNIKMPKIKCILLGSRFFKRFEVDDNKKDDSYHQNKELAVRLIKHCKKNAIKIEIMRHSTMDYSISRNPISFEDCYNLLDYKAE